MQALWILIRAQIKNKKGSYISIFILTFIIGFMLSSSLSLVVNIQSAAREAIIASDFGDLYFNFNLNYVPTSQDFNNLEQMPEINRVRPLKKIKITSEAGSILHKNGDKTKVSWQPAIYVYDKDNLPLRLLSEDKTSYLPNNQLTPPQTGKIYLPIAFMSMYGADFGDTYIIEAEEDVFEYEVSGFVEDITQINMISIGEHNVYLNSVDFSEFEKRCEEERENVDETESLLTDYLNEYNYTYTLHLNIADEYGNYNTDKLFQSIEDATGLRNKSFFYGDDDMFVYFASLVSYLVLLVILVFVVVLFIAGLAILNFNIYSSIEAEYKNIGVMKAIGLKKIVFNLVYLLSYLTVIIMGLVIGSLLSAPLLKSVKPLVLDLTGMLGGTKLALAVLVPVYLFLIIICLLLILWQLRSVNKIKPYKVLREGKQAVYKSSGLNIKLKKPLFNLRLSFKQFTASAGTYFASVFVITILFFFVLIGFSMTTLMAPDHMMEECWGFDWDLMVFYQNHDEYEKQHSEVDELILKETAVKDSYIVYNHIVNGLDQNIVTFSIPEEYIDRMTSLIEGRAPRSADEIAVTKILADSKDIKIGDEIRLSHRDKEAEYTVTGFFQTTNNVGRSVALTISAIERLLGDSYSDELTQVWYVFEDQTLSDRVKEKINAEYPDLKVTSVVETFETYGLMSDAFDILPAFIIAFTLVFVLISSFLLAEKIFYREQIDFGIMKAIGFKNSVTRQVFSLRFLIVALLGLISGSLIFYFGANPMLNKLVNLMGLSKVTIRVPLIQVLFTALVMLAVFWLIAYVISRKIKSLKVRDLVADV